MSVRDTDKVYAALLGLVLLWVVLLAGQATCMAKAERHIARENAAVAR